MQTFKLPKQEQYTIKSVRFPNTVIDRVDKVIKDTDYSFSAFVVTAVKYALDQLDENKNQR